MSFGMDAAIAFDPDEAASVRVVLVGFMGAGKTSLAQRWAHSGGPVLWFDSDRAVLRELGVDSVTRAFDEFGEPRFREVECDVIMRRAQRLVRGVEVWSLGGGALTHADVRGALSGDDTCVVWLDGPTDSLWERVVGSDRPLARDRTAFDALREARLPLYEQIADVRVDTTAPLDELGLGRELAERLPANWFGAGLAVGDGLLARIDDVAALDGGPVALVADRAVSGWADSVRDRLRHGGHNIVSDVRLTMGEFNKQLSTVDGLLTRWADDGVHRGVTVVAVGGGTLLDMAGFAASIYQRGLRWVSIPTTLVSQVDAGIGGKTGVNLGVVKNVVGTVHMPSATIVDPAPLATIDMDAFRDGFVEAAKTALLAGEWLVERVQTVIDASAGSTDRDAAVLELVAGCAGFKDCVVADDPFDTDGIRAQLNLGHTLAHAIEAATGGAVSHGAAVAIGTHAALRLSEAVLDAPEELAQRWCAWCAAWGIVTMSPLAWEALEPFLRHDKKRDERGLRWTLLAGMGQPVTDAYVPAAAMERVWNEHVVSVRDDVRVENASPVTPRVLVLFGVNLGQLGEREAEHYGDVTLPQLVGDIEAWAAGMGLVADCRQTDSLERFVGALHEARRRHHAVIVNPGAWTHHEYALHDALAPLDMPRVEVHLSDVHAREEAWRHHSVIRPVVDHCVTGAGADGYRAALEWIRAQLR